MARILLLAVVGLCATTPAWARQGDLLLLILGNDTISRERVEWAGDRVTVDMRSAVIGARFRFEVIVGPGGVPATMTNRFWQAMDSDTAPPRQTATFTFRGDSVITVIAGGATQRSGSEPGAVPFLNPSFALLELFLARAAALGGDSVLVPAFMVQGGQTVPFTITRPHPDSAVISIAGAAARLRVDATQRILGGTVPLQGLRIERVAASEALLAPPAPADYSAPPAAPYDAIEVRVPTSMGHTLAGTLTLPHGASSERRVGAVVTATGSGLQDRDEALPAVPGYRPFRQLADTLSRHGIAVLRMDDRGFGGSEGNTATAMTADFADDIAAGLAWLRNRPEIDPTLLGVVGHSEGGLIAPLLAAEDTTLRAIVVIAGPSRTGREIIAFQQRSAIDRAPGLSAAQRDSMAQAAQATLDSLATTSAWIRHFLDYDPLPVARRVRHAAVLIVQGATDLQVTADQAPELEAAFRAAGNTDVTMRIFPEANHLLIQDPDGNPAAYPMLRDRAVRPDILGCILEWLRERLR